MNRLLILIALIVFVVAPVSGQSTAFKFQGSLSDSGSPANGNFQMQFKLFDAVSGGNQVGPTLTDQPITAANGIFTVSLDFGIGPLSGANRWIEIAVRRNANESYVTLSPREQIASAPFSIRALSAQQADTALDSQKLGGVNANQFVQTNDARLSDPRTPLPGSTSYVQNQNAAPQAASNFNIAGSGTATSFNVNGPFNFGAVAAPPVAPAGQSRFYFDTATNKLRVSENGQPFVNLVGATGLSGSGSVNRIPFFSAATTLSDSNIFQSGSNIGIGIAPQSRFHAGGTAWFSGDSTPLPAAAGKGIAVGFAAEQGYIYGFDYTAFTPKNLIINHTGGSVGIGTATPDPGYRLDIGGAARVTAPAAAHFVAQTTGGTNTWARNYWRSTSQSWFMGTSQGFNGNQLYINDETANQTRMVLNTNGTFGFGTANPDGNFRADFFGSVRSFSPTAANIVAQTTGGTNTWARYYMRSPSQSWFMGTSQNFNGNQLYLVDETSGQTRLSIQPNGGVISLQGSVTQNQPAHGLPKLLAYINGDGTILSCYNGVTGVSTGNCGFDISRYSSGWYLIQPGFNIANRIVLLSVQNSAVINVPPPGMNYSLGQTSVTVFIFETNSVNPNGFPYLTDRPFSIAIF